MLVEQKAVCYSKGMKESSFWTYIKDKLIGHWTRIESPISPGIPDCLAMHKKMEFWVELKYLTRFEEGLGTSKVQRLWHQLYHERGGTSFLLARVGKLILLVHGDKLSDAKGDNFWLANAAMVMTVGKDVDGSALCDYMAEVAKTRKRQWLGL